MNSKKLVWLGMFVGSIIGSYIPTLWGAGLYSLSSLLFGAIGAIVGVWLGFRLGQ